MEDRDAGCRHDHDIDGVAVGGVQLFIAKVNTYNRLYGSLGTLLLLLVWVNANSAVLLLGFELDASIERARREAMTKFSGGTWRIGSGG